MDDVGLLDERLCMYWEDADLCRRMRQKGWKVVYFPQAAVFNHVGGSSRKRPIRSILEFHKSCYRLFIKYNSSSLSFLNPFVIGALALRLIFVISINRLVTCSSFLPGPLSSKIAVLIDPWAKDYRATSGDN